MCMMGLKSGMGGRSEDGSRRRHRGGDQKRQSRSSAGLGRYVPGSLDSVWIASVRRGMDASET